MKKLVGTLLLVVVASFGAGHEAKADVNLAYTCPRVGDTTSCQSITYVHPSDATPVAICPDAQCPLSRTVLRTFGSQAPSTFMAVCPADIPVGSTSCPVTLNWVTVGTLMTAYVASSSANSLTVVVAAASTSTPLKEISSIKLYAASKSGQLVNIGTLSVPSDANALAVTYVDSSGNESAPSAEINFTVSEVQSASGQTQLQLQLTPAG